MSVLKTDSRAKRAFVFVMAPNRDVKQNEVIIPGEVVTAISGDARIGWDLNSTRLRPLVYLGANLTQDPYMCILRSKLESFSCICVLCNF